MSLYSRRVQELVATLPNRGKLQTATHQARAENPACGDITDLYLEIRDERVIDCSFQTYGCPGAIAASAALTLLCKGRSVDDCRAFSRQDLLDYLEGLPAHKHHGLDLAMEALQLALGKPTL